MKIENVTYHNVTQGSPEWKALRDGRFTASSAAAALGRHKYTSRSELIKQLATGDEPEPTEAQARIFQKGHEAEAAARPIAEDALGEELYPATVTATVEGLPLLASVDGMDLVGDMVWEHKLASQALKEQIEAGEIEDHYIDQLQQQMLLTGAEVAVLVASDGTSEDWHEIEIAADPDRQKAIVDAWRQVAEEEATYQPAPEEAVAAPQEALPTPAVQVQGEVAVTGNLEQFGEALTAYIQAVNLKPQDDQEFADLDAAAKKLKKAEEALTAAEEQALAQTASIQELRQTISEYRETARQTRLAAERAVKSEKEARKAQIRNGAGEALRAHYQQINETLEGVDLGVPADFGEQVAEAMKGKKTIASLQDAADTTLANAKIAANERADQVRAVLQEIHALPEEYRHLFHDIEHLAGMGTEAAKATIKTRVDDEKERVAAIQRRQEEERKAAAESKAAEDQRQAEAERAKAEREAAEKEEQVAGMGQDAERDTGPIPRTTEELMQPQSEPPKGPESDWNEGRLMEATLVLGVPMSWTDDDVRAELQRRLSDLNVSVAVRRQEDAA